MPMGAGGWGGGAGRKRELKGGRSHLRGCMGSSGPQHVNDDHSFVRVHISIQHPMLQHPHPLNANQLLHSSHHLLDLQYHIRI